MASMVWNGKIYNTVSVGGHLETIWAEEGPGAFLQGAGSTAAGYFLAGAIAFGGTEILKREAIAALGPQVAIANSFAVVLVAGGALAVAGKVQTQTT